MTRIFLRPGGAIGVTSERSGKFSPDLATTHARAPMDGCLPQSQVRLVVDHQSNDASSHEASAVLRPIRFLVGRAQ